MTAIAAPATLTDVQEIVRGSTCVVPHGSRTKSAQLACQDNATLVDMSSIAGVIEYEPTEFTFTALAGTRLDDLANVLASNGQYLPFDPPFLRAGATLGGAVAAGLNGPCRLRYGGLRDFILGVRFVDGMGELVRGGGKVVKNAAGFDLPKLMVGSAGRLGVLGEITMKVFPAPEYRLTLRVSCQDLAAAVAELCRLTRQNFDLEAVDLEPPGLLWIRLAGTADGVRTHVQRLGQFIRHSYDVLSDAEEPCYWQAMTSFTWAMPNAAIVKVPVTPLRIGDLESRLPAAVSRRYSVAGNVAWLAWPGEAGDLSNLHSILEQLGLSGQQVAGVPNNVSGTILGRRTGSEFAARVKQALDPHQRFGALP